MVLTTVMFTTLALIDLCYCFNTLFKVADSNTYKLHTSDHLVAMISTCWLVSEAFIVNHDTVLQAIAVSVSLVYILLAVAISKFPFNLGVKNKHDKV